MEDLIDLAIRRVSILNGVLPCDENLNCLNRLHDALTWLNRRTRRRQRDGVEGLEGMPHKSEG